MTRWILNCDDVGMHPTINRAAAALFASGLVKACSVMPVGRAFDDAVTSLRGVGCSRVGVHLALNGEFKALPVRPLAAPQRVPGLVDGEGFLRANGPPPSLDEAAIELRAQIAAVIAAGFAITHLDGHMFFYDPGGWGAALLPLIEELAGELGVPVRRRDQVTFIWDGYDTAAARYHYYDRLIEAGDEQLVVLHPADSIAEIAQFSPAGERRLADFQYFSQRDLPARLAAAGIVTAGWNDLIPSS